MKRVIIYFVIIIFTFIACKKQLTSHDDTSIQENYTILFYGVPIDTDIKQIFTTDIDGGNPELIVDYGQLPVWYDNKLKILYMDKRYYQIKLKVLQDTTSTDSILMTYNENLDFMRYSKSLNCLLFQFKKEGRYRIAKIDLNTLILQDISVPPYDEIYPNTSEFDDWIYFSTKLNDTWDIYRMKIDRSHYQPILQDPNYNYNTFSVIADGNYIVSPKYNNGESYIVIYDIQSQKEEVIYKSNYDKALYTTFTRDNQYILFLIGIPYNYTTPRNIYRINKDGSNLKQLTYFENTLADRPLTW